MIIIPFLLLGLPIAVIAFIIIAALKWKQEGGENVFRQLYIHLVLFATLMLSIGGGIGIFTGLSDLISPTPYYETYNSFKQMKTSQLKDANQTLSEEQIRTEYDNNIEDNKERTKQEALNTVIRSLGFIIIPLPIFFYFNRGREKEKKDLVK